MTNKKENYTDYINDKNLQKKYINYQSNYKTNPRESDKKVIDLVKKYIPKKQNNRILDVACSTGNFLYHLKNQTFNCDLHGLDLSKESIEYCKSQDYLKQINFFQDDITKFHSKVPYHVITAIAVTCLLDDNQLEKALNSIYNSLEVSGVYIGFEWINPFNFQNLTIVETNEWNPQGYTIRMRTKKTLEDMIKKVGFKSISYQPFNLPFDIEKPGYEKDVLTYTVKNEDNERMAFRGILYQPWHHFVVKK